MLFQFFPRQLLAFFGKGNELYYQFAVHFMRVFLLMVLVNGVQLLSSNFFAAIGKPLKGMFLSMTRQVLFLMPLLVALPLVFGLEGILYAGPAADLAAFLVTLGFIVREMQNIRRKEEALSALKGENERQNESISRLNQEKLDLEGQRVRATKESQSLNEELLRTEGEVSRLDQRRVSASMEEKQLLDKLWETYELSHEAARQQRVEIESVQKASRRISELKRSISGLGNVNVGAIEEFQRVNERYTYLTDQRDDVDKAKKELEEIIAGITNEMKAIFQREFTTINEAFGQTFLELFGGGKATLELEDPEDILNCGIEIKVQPPGKALKIITLLSGGEKAFVAIALYFAILKVRPTPFVVMDEIEAALDDSNVVRFAHYMRNMSARTQFIVITHRRGTMEEADVLYGVTMQEQGVSRMLTINLNDVEKELNIR